MVSLAFSKIYYTYCSSAGQQ